MARLTQKKTSTSARKTLLDLQKQLDQAERSAKNAKAELKVARRAHKRAKKELKAQRKEFKTALRKAGKGGVEATRKGARKPKAKSAQRTTSAMGDMSSAPRATAQEPITLSPAKTG